MIQCELSPWSCCSRVRSSGAVAGRVVRELIGVGAWAVDGTEIPRIGRLLVTVGPCGDQLLGDAGEPRRPVSHRGPSVIIAVGARGTVPLGRALYLPEDWCEDAERRRKAKIPEGVASTTKPDLGVEPIAHAAGCTIAKGRRCSVITPTGRTPRCAHRLDQAGCEYVLRVGDQDEGVRAGHDLRSVPAKKPRRASRSAAATAGSRVASAIGEMLGRLGAELAQTVTFSVGPRRRTGPRHVRSSPGFRPPTARRDDQRRTGWLTGRRGSPTSARSGCFAEWPERLPRSRSGTTVIIQHSTPQPRSPARPAQRLARTTSRRIPRTRPPGNCKGEARIVSIPTEPGDHRLRRLSRAPRLASSRSRVRHAARSQHRAIHRASRRRRPELLQPIRHHPPAHQPDRSNAGLRSAAQRPCNDSVASATRRATGSPPADANAD